MAAEAVRAFMLSWFIAHHYSPAHAEAMVHQAYIESNLQPCVRSSTGSWLYGWVGVRRHALAAYAGTGGCPRLETQLSFADLELHREPAFWGFWRASSENAFAVLRRCFGRGQC